MATKTSGLHIWTIFERPRDAPDKYVVRRFSVVPGLEPIPLRDACYVDTLTQARAELPPGLYCLGREPSDHPTVVESWV